MKTKKSLSTHASIDFFLAVLLWLGTWPYHRTLRFYTIDPIQEISKCGNNTDLAKLIEQWRAGKDRELKFIKIAVSVQQSS